MPAAKKPVAKSASAPTVAKTTEKKVIKKQNKKLK